MSPPLPSTPGLVDDELPPGTKIAERYEVLGTLGQGGMGTVYAGRFEAVGRDVAIKVLSGRWSRNPRVIARFQAEARASNSVRHPNLVEVFDAGTLPDGRLFLVMERIAGSDLHDLLNRVGRFPIERACWIAYEVARGVRAAHEIGIVHRDLKPDNVMIHAHRDGEAVKVMDFGIASGVPAAGKGKTVPGSTIGTPDYMAPEQVDGHEATPGFDIYALGVVLFELLTGTLPIEDDNAAQLMARKTVEPAPSLATRRAGVPPDVVDLVDRCLQIDPRARPTMEEIIAVLAGASGSPITGVMQVLPVPRTTVRAPPATAPRERPTKPASGRARGNVLPIVSAVIAVALVSVAVLAWWDPGEEVKAPARTWLGPRQWRAPSDTVPRPGLPTLHPGAVGPPGKGGQESVPLPVLAEEPPTARPQPRPQPEPSTDATTGPKSRSPDSAECRKARKSAKDARAAHSWKALRRDAKLRGCWASESDRKKLLVIAHMNLGNFVDCVTAGRGLGDAESKKMVKICESRAD